VRGNFARVFFLGFGKGVIRKRTDVFWFFPDLGGEGLEVFGNCVVGFSGLTPVELVLEGWGCFRFFLRVRGEGVCRVMVCFGECVFLSLWVVFWWSGYAFSLAIQGGESLLKGRKWDFVSSVGFRVEGDRLVFCGLLFEVGQGWCIWVGGGVKPCAFPRVWGMFVFFGRSLFSERILVLGADAGHSSPRGRQSRRASGARGAEGLTTLRGRDPSDKGGGTEVTR